MKTAISCQRYQFDSPKGAQPVLSGISGQFTEGFDTPDLQEAKTLLDALTKEGKEDLP